MSRDSTLDGVRRRPWAVAALVLAVALAGVAISGADAPHYYSTSVSLMAVAFPDLNHAWVAGDPGGTRA